MNDKILMERLEEQLQSLAAYEDPKLAHTLEDAISRIIMLRAECEKLKEVAVLMTLKKGPRI